MGTKITNVWHAVAYEVGNISGLLLITATTLIFPYQGIWPRTWPLLSQWMLAVLLADVAFTWLHYISHRVMILWRLHAVHHGASRLYGFNGLVRHPLSLAFDMVLGTTPLVIAGMPVEVSPDCRCEAPQGSHGPEPSYWSDLKAGDGIVSVQERR